MFILSGSCDDAALERILYGVKNILTIIDIITPIILILMLSIHFTRAALNPEDKKKDKRIINSTIALFVVFMVPVIVNAAMHLVGEKTNISSCWINASKPEKEKESKNPGDYYKEPDEPTATIKPEKYKKDSEEES